MKSNKKIISNFKVDDYSYTFFRYHSLFFHSLIFRGRKLWAFKFLVNLKYNLKIKERIDPYWILLISLMKITPDFFLKSLKLSGKLVPVAFPILETKKFTFAVKFVIKLIRDKHRRLSVTLVCDALIGAIYNKGPSIQRKKLLYEAASKNSYYVKFFKW